MVDVCLINEAATAGDRPNKSSTIVHLVYNSQKMRHLRNYSPHCLSIRPLNGLIELGHPEAFDN